MEVRSVDDTGEVLGWGRHGELQFKGPGVLRHYKNHTKAAHQLCVSRLIQEDLVAPTCFTAHVRVGRHGWVVMCTVLWR